MDYTALAAVFTFVGIQFVISWNFHRIYLKLYNDFRQIVDKIAEARKKKFQEGLSTVVSSMQLSQKIGTTIPPILDFSSKAESLYTFVERLMTQAREPMDLYNKTRDATEKAYKNFALSGLVTLLGVLPLVSSESSFIIVYFVIAIVVLFAIISWDDFNGNMKKLVKLRDAGE